MAAKKTKETDIKAKIVEISLALAVEQGWEKTSLRDIAEKAGLSLAELYDVIDDKEDVLVLLGRMIDKQVMAGGNTPDEDVSARDRLFDLMMDRYDALNEHRDGVMAILESFKYDPKQMVISLPHLCRSMTWMLEACHLDTTGIKGAIKVAGLTGVYIKVLRTWMDDDSPDLSKTMAALDKALERVERTATTLGI